MREVYAWIEGLREKKKKRKKERKKELKEKREDEASTANYVWLGE